MRKGVAYLAVDVGLFDPGDRRAEGESGYPFHNRNF